MTNSPLQRQLVRPTALGSIAGDRNVRLDKPKSRTYVPSRLPAPKVTKPKSPAKGIIAPKKKKKVRPLLWSDVLGSAASRGCNAWNQRVGKDERWFVNAPRGMRFKVSGLHGGYRTGSLDLRTRTVDWNGTKDGFADLLKLVRGGFYYCAEKSCDFHNCPMSYTGPRKKSSKKKSKPVRGEGVFFGDGQGNRVTWTDDGEMTVEILPTEFHAFEVVR